MQELATKSLTKGKRVLVVDDHDNIRRTLQFILEAEGFHITEASSLESGKEALKHSFVQNPFDLVLLDIRLEIKGPTCWSSLVKRVNPLR